MGIFKCSQLRTTVSAAVLGTALLFNASTSDAAGTLRIANMGEPKSMDPQQISGEWEKRITGSMFIGLTTEDQQGQAIAGAAESWTISEDGKVYTFKIREHKWTDGTPVTAHDFVFALKRILDPMTAAEYASLMYPIVGAEEYNTGKGKVDGVGVLAKDDQTLEITLKKATPYFLGQLAHPSAYPLPKHVVEKHGKAWVKIDNIVSNGAFMLEEWAPSTHVKLKKNPGYWDAANVSLDGAIFYPGEDRTAGLKRFRAGEVDWVTETSSDQYDWLKENLPNQFKISPYIGTYFYPFQTEKKPFDDVRVRKALSLVVNREAIAEKIMKSGEMPAYSFVPPGMDNHLGGPSFVDWKDQQQSDRIKEAKKLLKEAGYDKDNPLKFTLNYNTSESHKKVAIAVSAMWRQALGVQASLFNSEIQIHYNSLKEGDFEVARAGWIADYNDPQNFLFLLQGSTGPLNYSQYNNPKYNDLMDRASKMVDLKQRALLLQEAEKIAMADQPVMPIYYYVSKNIVSSKIKGWTGNAQDIHRLRYISID